MNHMMKRFCLPALILITATCGAYAQEKAEDPWETSLSFSYVATSGNSDTSTLGTGFDFKRIPDPWGIEGGLGYLRSEKDDEKTAERAWAKVRGTRSLSDRWIVFLGAKWDRDEFGGIDGRYVFETGATFKALCGPKHHLEFDAGLTHTTEEYTDGTNGDYFGGLLGMRYAYAFTETSKFSQRLVFIPDFEESSNWLLESETAVEAALTDHMALKAGVLVKRDNEPPVGFKKTDTTTTVSLVFRF